MGLISLLLTILLIFIALFALMIMYGKFTSKPKQVQITEDNRVILFRQRPPTTLEFYADALFNSFNFTKPGKFPATGLKHSFELTIADATVSSKEVALWNKVAGYDTQKDTVHPMMYFTKDISAIAQLFCQPLWPTRPVVGIIHTRQTIFQKRFIKVGEKVSKVLSCERVSNQNEFEIKTKIYPQGQYKGPDFIAEGTSVMKFPKKGSGNQFEKSSLNLLKLVPMVCPKGKGLEWASVSQDYNPWHISHHLARLFGFRGPVLHGYCTISMVTSIVKELWEENQEGVYIDAQWKRPIFMPSKNKIFIRKELGETNKHYILSVMSQCNEHQHIYVHVNDKVCSYDNDGCE